MASIFNWRIAIAYVVVGFVLAVVGGTVIGKAHLEDYVEPFVFANKIIDAEQGELTRRDRVNYAIYQVREIVERVWLYILIGVGIGAGIHNWLPENIISGLLGNDKLYAVPLATVVGTPMYADIFGTLPIAEALMGKGAGLGTVLSFMMAVTALSLPSIIMLKE